MSSMADRRDPRGDALLRAFARDLAKLRRDLRNLEAANQISSASIEGGTLDVYDDDDVLRERIGKQANGSYGRLVLEGPVPPVPSEPDVQVIADGVVAITWDGRCEEKWPFVEFEAVRVHLVEDPVAEVCDRDNQVGVIRSHRGGTIVAVTESDDDNPVYARLVAVSTAGHTSDPSPAVVVDELDEDDLEEEPEELEWEDGDGVTLTQAHIDAGTVTFGLSHDPEVESLLAWWHPGGLGYAGEPQSPGVYTINFDDRTITWTLTPGIEAVGDRLRVYYPYYSGAASGGVLVDWQATGWRYLQIADADTTDRSAIGFDDTGWSTGTGAFGHAATYLATDPPPPTTDWTPATALWVRRTLDTPADAAVDINIRVEADVDVYWNGVNVGYVGNPSGNAVRTGTVTVTATGSGVLAFRVGDNGELASAGGSCYFDAQVVT